MWETHILPYEDKKSYFKSKCTLQVRSEGERPLPTPGPLRVGFVGGRVGKRGVYTPSQRQPQISSAGSVGLTCL